MSRSDSEPDGGPGSTYALGRPQFAPRWATLLSLTAISGSLLCLAFPRWRLVSLLGGPPIYSRPSITFGPGQVQAAFLLCAWALCVSLLRNPAAFRARAGAALLALAAALLASLVLAQIPREGQGYSLGPTSAVRIGQFLMIPAVFGLLWPFGSRFHGRVLPPESRAGQPHPAFLDPDPSAQTEEPG